MATEDLRAANSYMGALGTHLPQAALRWPQPQLTP